MLENAPRAAAAAEEADGDGVEWTTVGGIEGDDRPLEGGDSEGTFSGGGVG